MKFPGIRWGKKRVAHGEPWRHEKIRHVGFRVSRCRTSRLERMFAEHWMAQQRRLSGESLLQCLFNRGDGAFDFKRPRLIVNRRDAFVAATVIQWLGTNIGIGFLMHVLRRCGYEIRKIDHDLHDNYYHPELSGSDESVVLAGAWQAFAAPTHIRRDLDLKSAVEASRRKPQPDLMPIPFKRIRSLTEQRKRLRDRLRCQMAAVARNLQVPSGLLRKGE